MNSIVADYKQKLNLNNQFRRSQIIVFRLILRNISLHNFTLHSGRRLGSPYDLETGSYKNSSGRSLTL